MARIPDEEIARLKKEIPSERLVTGFGVELKRQGKDLFGRCPFRDDRTPSLSVSPETICGTAWAGGTHSAPRPTLDHRAAPGRRAPLNAAPASLRKPRGKVSWPSPCFIQPRATVLAVKPKPMA